GGAALRIERLKPGRPADLVARVKERCSDRGVGEAVGLGQANDSRRLSDAGLGRLQIRPIGQRKLLKLGETLRKRCRPKGMLDFKLLLEVVAADERPQGRLGGLQRQRGVCEIGLELKPLKLDLQEVRAGERALLEPDSVQIDDSLKGREVFPSQG